MRAAEDGGVRMKGRPREPESADRIRVGRRLSHTVTATLVGTCENHPFAGHDVADSPLCRNHERVNGVGPSHLADLYANHLCLER